MMATPVCVGTARAHRLAPPTHSWPQKPPTNLGWVGQGTARPCGAPRLPYNLKHTDRTAKSQATWGSIFLIGGHIGAGASLSHFRVEDFHRVRLSYAVSAKEAAWSRLPTGNMAMLNRKSLHYHHSPQAKRFTSAEWLQCLRSISQSQVLRQIQHPLMTMTLVAILCSVAHCALAMPMLPLLPMHTFLGSCLSLLLVFRTTTAYQRFQEGRKIWNEILNLCRGVALTTSLYHEEIGAQKVNIVKLLLQAFPLAMQEHVQARSSIQGSRRLQLLLWELHQESTTNSFLQDQCCSFHRNQPLHLVSLLLEVFASCKNCGEMFTNRERCWLLQMVTSLSHTVGRCERLLQTPVPRSYTRHTSRFVSIYMLTLPFALVSSLGWFTAPVIAVVAWALFGILEIGHSIEDPFRDTIELEPICEAIHGDCERILSDDRTSVADAEEHEDEELFGISPGHPLRATPDVQEKAQLQQKRLCLLCRGDRVRRPLAFSFTG